ncbi:MAG: malate dehydrogenase [Candidatus Hydrothermarchaeaceae archaeon]
MRRKITIVGAGNVGQEVVAWSAVHELGDIVWVNRTPETAMGKAMDLMHASPLLGLDVDIKGTGDYAESEDSDIVVITAGLPRKPGMPRSDLLDSNARILRSIVNEVKKHSPDACLIVLTNPLDAMVYVAYKESGFPRERVVGMSGVLDSTRFRSFIAQKAGVSYEDVFAMVIGGHGDDMVPLERFSCIAGIPAEELLDEKEIKAVKEEVRRAGERIVELLNANASFSVGAAAVEMVESIIRDKKRVMPCSVYLNGEYGLKDVCIGVPVVLGASGVERIIEVELTEEERNQFERSVAGARKLIEKLVF